LPRNSLLLPNYDSDGDGFIDNLDCVLCEEPTTPGELPVVPLDARPVLTFGKPVWDTACVGINAYPLDSEWQKLGHEGDDENLKDYEYKFELIDLLLEKK